MYREFQSFGAACAKALSPKVFVSLCKFWDFIFYKIDIPIDVKFRVNYDYVLI